MAVAGAGALLAGIPAGSAQAGGGIDDSCPVQASAHGVQVTVTQSDNLLVGSPTGPGVPVAQSCVDFGVGNSLAFASSPYPGDSVVSAPGLLSGPTGHELPAYPAYAGSRFPRPQESSVNQPGIALNTTSSQTASRAEARHSVDQVNSATNSTAATGDATAVTVVDPNARTSTAKATADLQPLTINGVLALGEVVSSASATLTPAGGVQRDSQMQIGRTMVAGQEVVITPNGVQAAGQAVAAPSTAAIQQALAQAGVMVTYLAAQNTPGGVVSAGIEITATQNDPSGAAETVHLLLGRAFATAAPVQAESNSSIDLGLDTSIGADSGDGSGDGSGEAISAGPPGDAALLGGAVPTPSGPMVPQQPQQQRVVLTGRPVDMGLGAGYLMIVFGAMAMFVSGTLVRLLGVKTRWMS